MQKLGKIIGEIKDIDYSLSEKIQSKLDNLTKPVGSLGRLEELAKQLVMITKNFNPTLKNKVIFTMAADHGVTEEGVSAYPKEVTAQMVYNFLRGGAGINVLAKHVGARVVVVDMGVAEKIRNLSLSSKQIKSKIHNFKDKKINLGTKNMVNGQAMSKKEATKSIEAGIKVFEQEKKIGIDIVGTGDMGIGNTTASSAITSAITGRTVEEVTGRGTGIDDKTLVHKIEVIKMALEINKPNSQNALDVLSKVGGYEIAGLVGIILACASCRVPVIIDGFISGASALVAYKLEPKVRQYMFASHCSQEKGHRVILDFLGLKPILELNLRLGEGTGAALAMGIIEAAAKILTQMATFQNAGVSKKIK